MSTVFNKQWDSMFPEERLATALIQGKGLSIGIPKENLELENRVALTPEAVSVLTAAGRRVIVEKDAGAGAHFSDYKYSEAGAEICEVAATVFKCDIIVKVSPPHLHELHLMEQGATVFSLLSFNLSTKAEMELMMSMKMTAIAYELIQDEYDLYPWLDSLSEMDGVVALNVISEMLSSHNGGKGVLLGGVAGIPPTDLVIIGAETTALVAARVALSMGATVKIFDSSVAKLKSIEESLNQRIYTSTFHPNTLLKALRSADAVIGCMRTLQAQGHYVIPSDYVLQMKKGAIVVDLNTDLYCCFETSEYCSMKHPVINKNGVLHYCNPHLSTYVSKTASIALSNVIQPLLLKFNAMPEHHFRRQPLPSIFRGAYMYQGILVNAFIGGHYSLSFRDFDLFY